jgi:hypothetical protein
VCQSGSRNVEKKDKKKKGGERTPSELASPETQKETLHFVAVFAVTNMTKKKRNTERRGRSRSTWNGRGGASRIALA